MTDDIGHESFPSTATAAPPAHTSHPPSGLNPQSIATSYIHYNDYTHYDPWTPSSTTTWQMPSPIFPRERTVHTVYFKIWDPDSPARSLYVEEINQQGIVRQFDPEHFFHKLTGDHIQANQMSDYWRSHYGLPLKHGGTPFQPTSEQVAGLASARLLRHGLVGDREHVAEPVAGLAPLHGFSARFIWRS